MSAIETPGISHMQSDADRSLLEYLVVMLRTKKTGYDRVKYLAA